MLGIYNYVDNQSHHIYGSSRLGEAESKYSAKGQQKFGGRTYEISNHLGNVLASISDMRHTTDSTWADINSVSDYYPFGLQMSGRTVNDYRYGFNGKEKDPKVEWGGNSHYDHGFRIYNPEIARFLSVDPLSDEFPWNSPYSYAENDVIRSVDLDGLEKIIVIGGADLDGTGLSSTMIEIKTELQTFSDANSLGFQVKSFNTKVDGSTILEVYNYLKNNVEKGEPVLFYGYSLGGHTANQVAKLGKLDGLIIDFFVAVDAAFGIASSSMEVSENVNILFNIYQTDRSIILSRGYPAKAEEGNNKTLVINYPYDDEKEEKGLDSHAAMDEETKAVVLEQLKGMMELLNNKGR